MKLDTGSDVNMLHLDDFNSLQPRSQMKQTKVKLTAYKGEDIHVCEGTRSVSIETPRSQTNSLVRPMSVASAVYMLSGRKMCDEKIMDEYQDLFKGLGCVPGEISIKLRPDAEPCRTMPFGWFKEVVG